MKIFISSAEEDNPKAFQIYSDLKKAGYSPWMADKDLLPGHTREREIAKAVRECSVFLALISSASVAAKGDYQVEMKLALKEYDGFSEGSIFLIPVSIDGTEPAYEKLREIVKVDLSESYKAGFQGILKALKSKQEIPLSANESLGEPHDPDHSGTELTEPLTLQEQEALRAAIEKHPLIRSENMEDRKAFLVRCGVPQIFKESDRSVPTSTFLDLVLYRLETESLLPRFQNGFNVLNEKGEEDRMSAQEDPVKKMWNLKLDFIREAIKAVPAVKWALGVGGTAAVVSMVLGPIFGLPPKTAVIGLIIAFILMGVLVIFSRMSVLRKDLVPIAKIFSWFVLVVFMAVTVLLIGCAFFDYPKPLALLFGTPQM